MNCSKNIHGRIIKYDCQMKIIYEIIDVKEQIWLKNVKHLRLSLDTSWVLVFFIDAHVCTKVIGINEDKKKYVKCIVHMHITATLKAYWLLVILRR